MCVSSVAYLVVPAPAFDQRTLRSTPTPDPTSHTTYKTINKLLALDGLRMFPKPCGLRVQPCLLRIKLSLSF